MTHSTTGRAMGRVLQRLRDQHSDMSLVQALAFFAIAETPGIKQSDLYRLLGVSDSAASRVVAILGDIGGRTVPPLYLIDVRPDPSDRRERILRLTTKGKRPMDIIEIDLAPAGKEV